METNLMLFAHLLTVLPIDTPQRVGEVLTRLCGHAILPEPYYFGEGDPPTVPWDAQSIFSITRQLARPSCRRHYWRRGAGQEAGTISTGLPHLHSIVRVKAAVTPELVSSYGRFFQEQSIALRADIALIHVSGENRPLRQDEPEYAMRIGLSTLQLRQGLPDLAWATVFGTPYVEMFGRERLLSTPAARVDEIGGGSIYVQLTDTLDADVAFERSRHAAKAHLGLDAFRNSGPARVPAFNLKSPSGPRLLGWVNGLPVTGMIAGKPIVQTDHGPKVIDASFDPGGKNP